MRLDVLWQAKAKHRNGRRWTTIFSTPGGTKVVRIKDRYYPVGKRGQINTKICYVGNDGEHELWRIGRGGKEKIVRRELETRGL